MNGTELIVRCRLWRGFLISCARWGLEDGKNPIIDHRYATEGTASTAMGRGSRNIVQAKPDVRRSGLINSSSCRSCMTTTPDYCCNFRASGRCWNCGKEGQTERATSYAPLDAGI